MKFASVEDFRRRMDEFRLKKAKEAGLLTVLPDEPDRNWTRHRTRHTGNGRLTNSPISLGGTDGGDDTTINMSRSKGRGRKNNNGSGYHRVRNR